MSLSVMAVRIIGLVVAILGLLLVLSSVGVGMGVHIPVSWIIELVVGLLMIGAGAYIIQGGTITT